MAELPSGTVTFLFTDLEGSTRLWEEHREAMRGALARHDEILRDAVTKRDGHVVKTTGDGLHAVFATAGDALAAAVDAQLGLETEDWPLPERLRVRMGLHTGGSEVRAGDYYGPAVNRAARVAAAGHGGQILVSHATEELVRDDLPVGVGLLDLGEQRLRDLERPERVFQVTHGGLAGEFGRLRSLDAFPGNLPSQVTSFVGRDAELGSITMALDTARLVTLTGVGGVGKTRLAVQVAAEVLPRFADGAWFCELAAAEDAETMAQVVAASLGVAPRPEMSLASSIVDYLRTKRLMVVLDNCEHLLDPAGRLADAILRGCPEVRVLATSREVLSVDGEQVVGLRSLPLPDESESLDELGANDAARLFVERASASRSGFFLDAGNAAAVGEVCRRLDGIPLAIELAAARVGSMSPSEIAGLLDERFRLLRGGRRTAMERHQTLRATVDWSYSLLSDTERSVFDRLGVFAGSFDAAAVRAVVTDEALDGWDALDGLASLVAKSMVVADETPDGTTRYALLETLRAYARERLDEAGESDPWRRRHGQYFALLAEEIGPGLMSPDELAWQQRFSVELDNLRAAVVWALDSTSDADRELAMRIVAALAIQALNRKPSGVGALAERTVSDVEATAPGRRAMILAAAAIEQLYRGDVDRARRLALDATRDGAPDGSLFPILPFSIMCMIDGTIGQHAAVSPSSTRPSPPTRSSNTTRHGRMIALVIAVYYQAMAGARSEARARSDQLLDLARQSRVPSLLAAALGAFGFVLVETDPDAATAAFEESVALTRAGASDGAFAGSLGELALLHAQAGNLAKALGVLRNAVVYTRDVGNRLQTSAVLTRAVEIIATAGQDEAAVVISSAVAYGDLRSQMLAVVEQQQSLLDQTRSQLGDTRYEAARARGARLSYDDLVAYTLAEIDNALTKAGPSAD